MHRYLHGPFFLTGKAGMWYSLTIIGLVWIALARQGDWSMSTQQAVNEIKEAESRAEEIVKQANLQAQEVLKQAEKQAGKYISEKTQEAREKAEQAARKIIAEAERERVEIEKATRDKIKHLEETAANNIPPAVDWLVVQLNKPAAAKS